MLLKHFHSLYECNWDGWNWADWTSRLLDCSESSPLYSMQRCCYRSFSFLFFSYPSLISSSLVFGLHNVLSLTQTKKITLNVCGYLNWPFVQGRVCVFTCRLPSSLAGGWAEPWLGGSVQHPASILRCGSLTSADGSYLNLLVCPIFLTISFTFFCASTFFVAVMHSHIATVHFFFFGDFFCIVYKLDCCEQCMMKLHPLTNKNKQKKQEWAVVQCLWVSEFSVNCLCTLNTLSYIK